jgi:hypothetical protein
MYIAKQINCNVKALSRIAAAKFSRDTWLFNNTLKVDDFEAVCRERGSQVILVGTRWSDEAIPYSVTVFRNDRGVLMVRGN